MKQGYLFLVETYKKNIPCTHLDFSPIRGKGEEDETKVDQWYVILFCKKEQ